eukprot:1855394-Rhodomonas_salina.1
MSVIDDALAFGPSLISPGSEARLESPPCVGACAHEKGRERDSGRISQLHSVTQSSTFDTAIEPKKSRRGEVRSEDYVEKEVADGERERNTESKNQRARKKERER